MQGTDAIRYWDSSLADWAPITDATHGEDYTLEYLTTGDLAGNTLLTVGKSPDLPGDYNGNGVVDAADYTVWRNNLGAFALLPNDILPGIVDQYDYTVWKTNFGNTGAGAATANAAVPEPASWLLIIVAVVSAVGCRHRVV